MTITAHQPIFHLMIRLALASLFLTGALTAEPTGPPTEPTPSAEPATERPNVTDLGDGNYQVGLVTFNKTTRQISFPTELNMDEGLLEYAIVHENGKIHEALLHTKARPFHINLALKLLRYKASEELFQILDEDYKPTGKYPEIPEAIRTAARIEILLAWKTPEGKDVRATLNELITNTVTEAPMTASHWVYGGSYLHEGRFTAETSGDIAAIFTSSSSLFNYPGKAREDDTIWIPTPKRTPLPGTKVTVTIQPLAPAKN